MNKVMTKSPWQSEIWNRKPKNEAQIAAYRWKHSTDERRRRGEMKDLFEKLQLVLGWPALPQVAKRILLNRASEEIQRLKDNEDRLTSEKKLLMSKQNALIRHISALSGKSQQAILKKLEYISAKQKAPETQKNQQQCQGEPVDTENDSFIMPRIVNVMTLAAEDAHINLEVDKYPHVILGADSQAPKRSLQVVSQEVTHEQPDEKAEVSCGKESSSPRTRQKDHFPQIVNFSSSEDSFAAKLCFEEFAGSQAVGKQIDCEDGQKAKDSLSQKLQPKDSGIEKDLQNVASAIQEAALDASDLINVEENDDTDETLLLNETAFLNRQLNDDSSDIAELPNSLSSGFFLREPSAAHGSPFQFGALGKDLCLVQDSNGSITPLLLHLEDDNLAHGDKNLRDPVFEWGVLKFMPDHEVKDSKLDYAVITSDNGPKYIAHLVNTANVSPSILQVRTNLEPNNTDAVWKPMPKLAPFGLKGTNFQLASGQNSKVMPLLSHVGTKASSIELKVSQRQDYKIMPVIAPMVTESR